MTVFPDIIREPSIISIKPNGIMVKSSASGSSLLTDLKKLNNNATPVSGPSSYPALIFNDTNRSTSYHRLSSNGELSSKLVNSPLETNVLYNWPATQRFNTSEMKSRSRVYKPVSRISQPGRPPAPYKVHSSYETEETNFHNEKRTLEMKRWQYFRDHTQWSIFPYAPIDERECYNKQIRETLKDQMEQKLRNSHRDFIDNCKESKIILQKDQKDIDSDKRNKAEKMKYLNQYSLTNKQLMEDRWMSEYSLKRNEWINEKQILSDDPINWSKTLR